MTGLVLEGETAPLAFELTAEQRAIVEWAGGPLIVLAGAGTGKTTVIVERVRHLLQAEPELEPEQILVLTYNVRAAAELRDRFGKRLGPDLAARLNVHNFHSFGHRLLREHGAELGIGEARRVLDPVGERLLLRQLRPELDLLYYALGEDASWTFQRFSQLIARAKDELVTPEAYAAFARARRDELDARRGAGTYEAALRSMREDGTLAAAKVVRKELGRNPEAMADREARRTASGIGKALTVNQLTPAQRELAAALAPTYLRDAEVLEVLRLEEEAQVFARYQEALAQRGWLDFGEQIRRSIELLERRPNICLRYQRQFRHILVDEFQDANIAQILLLELLGRSPEGPENIMVVGDDDQSIYRFRGASYAAFRELETRFARPPAWDPDRPTPPVKRLPLLLNRRSTGRILSAASRLIESNEARLKADLGALRPSHDRGDEVEIIHASTDVESAEVIARRIREIHAALVAEQAGRAGAGGHVAPGAWSRIAVLYRKHAHREPIVERLRREGIPHVVIGGSGLFAHPEIRDLEAALRFLADPNDSPSLTRILTAGPWRLDATEILRVTRAAAFDRSPVIEAIHEVLRSGEIEVDEVAPPDAEEREWRRRTRLERLDARLRTRLGLLVSVLGDLPARGHRDGPFTILEEYLVRTNLLHDLIATETPEAQRSVLAIARLMRFVSDWQREHEGESLAAFVDYLDVYAQVGGDLDVEDPRGVDADGVRLMTVYQAKGLEFDAVIVPRLEKGQFPDERGEELVIPVELLRQAPPPEFAVAEERRLAFVAMTRAKRRLILVGTGGDGGRSQFLGELEAGEGDEGGGSTLPDDIRITELATAQGGDAGELELPEGADPEEARLLRETTDALLRRIPVAPSAEARFAARRRAVELIGALEALDPDDGEGRRVLLDELVAVASAAASDAAEARAHGIDPLTLRAVSTEQTAGAILLGLAPLPSAFSHSQLRSYDECPLRYAFEKLYRIPVESTKGYFEFGTAVHSAFEEFGIARREARAAGLPDPGFEALESAFTASFGAAQFEDREITEHYRTRGRPALERFFERELQNPAEAIGFELGFDLRLEPGDGSPVVAFGGKIDRIDRHPDGSVEVIDYKTGRPKSQPEVDRDEQLSAYALALREGGVRDPKTGERLPTPTRLTLYFVESDLRLTTSRTDEQLDTFKTKLLETVGRIRGGCFAANPTREGCARCDYRRLCPNRAGEQVSV